MKVRVNSDILKHQWEETTIVEAEYKKPLFLPWCAREKYGTPGAKNILVEKGTPEYEERLKEDLDYMIKTGRFNTAVVGEDGIIYYTYSLTKQYIEIPTMEALKELLSINAIFTISVSADGQLYIHDEVN